MFHRGSSAFFAAVYPDSEDELIGNSRKGKARVENDIKFSEDSEVESILKQETPTIRPTTSFN